MGWFFVLLGKLIKLVNINKDFQRNISYDFIAYAGKYSNK